MRALQNEKSIIVPISSLFKAVVKNIDTTFWVEWYISICNMLKTDTVLVRLVLNILYWYSYARHSRDKHINETKSTKTI